MLLLDTHPYYQLSQSFDMFNAFNWLEISSNAMIMPRGPW